MKLIILAAVLTLASCGKDSSSDSSQKETAQKDPSTRPSCGGEKSSLCTPRQRWLINMNDVELPENFVININGRPIIGDCKINGGPEVSQTRVTPGKLTLDFFSYSYETEMVQVEILDSGEDCKDDLVFYNENDVRADAQRRGNVIEITLELTN